MPATLTDAQAWTIDRDETAEVVFIRSPHATAIEPAEWRQQFVAALRRNPGAAIVGAKRLDAAGKLFSMGEQVIHPKGFHFQGKGETSICHRFPVEVDAISGGVLAVAAEHFEAVEGESLCQGELGLLTLCLAVRARGGRCLALPSVVAIDSHSPSPPLEEEQAFEARFGVDWLAPDLELLPAGSPLLWNARFQGVALPFEKYETRAAVHWENYAEVEPYRQRADHLVKIVRHFAKGRDPVLDLGCGDGLFTHLVARKGLTATGLDPESTAIEQAREQCSGQRYPGASPSFAQGSAEEMPYADATFRVVFMLDVIEHLPNPVRVLREAARVLQPQGHLLITTPAWQYGAWSDPVYHVDEYSAEELVRQVAAATRHHVPLGRADLSTIGGIYRDLVLITQRQ
jgi:ubiquinone/menaquinone biosynthesis C-methylase UbiE